MAYTAIDDAEAYFQAKTYTGDGSTPSITFDGDTDMQPDLVWYKSRSNAYSHGLFDVLRGASEQLYSDSTTAEATYSGVSSFDSDGFTLGTDAGGNENSATYVAWCWKAGGSGSANTTGATSSTVSVNSTSKFSIVQWTGTGSTTTVGHSLGVVPDMFITKSTGTGSWGVYHQGSASSPEDGTLLLNGDGAWYDHTAYYNDTAPTSTVFTVNSDDAVNKVGTMIAYCFSSVQGFSKFGSYTGNGDADGAFVYTGFRPAFVINKRTDNTSGWDIFDNKRSGYNVVNRLLGANVSDVESTTDKLDILSNGFKMRTDSGGNYSDAEYVYIAFAESPLVNSNGVPTNAR